MKSKRGRPKGSKSTKPSECLAIYVNFGTREERRALERLVTHYKMPRARIIRALIAEADRLRAAGGEYDAVRKAAE